MKFRKDILCRAIVAHVLLSSTSVAGPIEQIRSASKLSELRLDALKRGEIVAARGPLGNFLRGVYVENCYFVRASLEAVGEKLLHWDTTKHPEFEVSILREFRWPAPPNVFDALHLNFARKEDQWLIDRTFEVFSSATTGALHITADEAKAAQLSGKFSVEQRDGKVSEFWKKILASRNKAIGSGGLNALPSFSVSQIDISILDELKRLMTLAPTISSRFETLLSTRPFAESGNAPDEIAPYWQETRVRGHTTLNCGFLSARKTNSWQVTDCTYFTSDTFFMSITLFELFPIENGTLVWQIDFVSAPFRSYLGGTDRFFAGKEMVKESAKTIRLFRADLEQHP